MGFISLSVSLWIKQSFGYIILIIIYLIVQMIIDSSNDISFVLSFVFPILDSNSEFIFGYFNFILLFLIYLFLGIVQYYLIDF